MPTLQSRSSRAELRRTIASIPQELSSGATGVQDILRRCGQLVLDKIRDAFLVKSAGGTDEAGERWVPLKPTTIAYSRSGRNTRERNRSQRPSQGLTNKQQKEWWDLYRQGLAIYRGDKASAAKRAWGIMKQRGVKTLISKYGAQRVDILYNTGTLFNSITSHVTSTGNIVVSSKHPTAAVHHNGSQSRGIPQRRLWPDPANWPSSWWSDIIREVRDGVEELVKSSV